MPWRPAGRQRDPRPASGVRSSAAWFDTPRRALWGYFALRVCAEDGHGGRGWSHLARLVRSGHSFGAGKPCVAARCGEGARAGAHCLGTLGWFTEEVGLLANIFPVEMVFLGYKVMLSEEALSPCPQFFAECCFQRYKIQP